MRCGLHQKWTWGIFCTIFYWSMKNYAPCQQMWCGGCYTSNPSVLFQIKSRVDKGAERDNNLLMQERLMPAWGNKHELEEDFKVAREPYTGEPTRPTHDGMHATSKLRCILEQGKKYSSHKL